MRFAFPLASRSRLPLLLTAAALFSVGLWLGGVVLPASALCGLYQQGEEVTASALPAMAATAAPQRPHPAPLLLDSAGLPVSILDQQPPEPAAPVMAEESLLVLAPAKAEAPAAVPPAPSEPQVAIYCSHAGEGYAGETRVNGAAGGVTLAAQSLAAAFESQGVGVVLDLTLHDSPSYDDSYARSQETAEAIAAQYPQIEVYIDVHRDSSIAGVSTRLTNELGSFAKMLLVVGSDENLPHPNWRENYRFAQAVTEAANRRQSGIMREPRVYSGRYNQHIAAKAILVEIGSTDNTLAEAQRSAEILAGAVLDCLDQDS